MGEAHYWNRERIGFAIMLGGMAAAAMAGWFHFNDKLDDLASRVNEIDQRTVEDRCTQILARQVAAIEAGRSDVLAKIESLSRDQGCLRRYDYVLVTGSSARELSTKEIAKLRRRAAEERKAFENSMADIDQSLSIHPPFEL